LTKDELTEHLKNFRYQSISRPGERGLMQHHIKALSDYLYPLLQKEGEAKAHDPNCYPSHTKKTTTDL